MAAEGPSPTRRRECLGALAAAAIAQAAPVWAAVPTVHCQPADWAVWQAFAAQYIQQDGRVIDASTPQQHSSSEGQSYAMFFALVANDPARFDQLWRWTVDNLFGGQVAGRLPAWIWGRAPDGAWRVLDDNSASDADLWLVYALLEAARLWGKGDYARDAMLLLAEIERREVVELPGLGAMLLPGERGFIHRDGAEFHLNPSYLPLPLLRRLATASPRGPWARVALSTVALLEATAGRRGLAPDWAGYVVEADGKGRFVPHPSKSVTGSYDAIRTYLWAGMTAPSDPLASSVRKHLHGMANATPAGGAPPEIVNTVTGEAKGSGPFGFSAALLPLLEATGRRDALASQRERVNEGLQKALGLRDAKERQQAYYDLVLSLFGQGWSDGRYRFARTGTLEPAWKKNLCRATVR